MTAALDRLSAYRPGAYEVIRYGPAPEQFAELWCPDSPEPAPVVALLHGGYWRARYDLAHLHALAASLRGQGYAVWNVEYRRMDSPGGGWPGTFLDVHAALEELAARAGATVPPLDLARLTVLGHSAGGHLALWAAGRRELPGTTGPARVRPALAVSLAGVTDLVEAARRGLSGGAVTELLGGGPAQVPGVYRLACPVQGLPLGVPTLVVHGDADQDVPYDLAGRYVAAAGAAGDRCTFLPLPGVEHFALIDPASPAWAAVLAELNRLAGPAVPDRPARTSPS